jgi:transposase-like protein
MVALNFIKEVNNMSFIRAKQIPPRTGNWYDYEVMTIHEGSKVRQKVLRYIGRSGRNGGSARSSRAIRQTVTAPVIVASTPAIPKVSCKICHSDNTRKYGLYNGIQNYYCNDCHTKFTGTDALPQGRVSPEHIVNALDGFYSGLSFHDIEHDIDARTDEGISHTAVYKWINKYTSKAINATKDLHPNVGDTWIADETYVRVDKSNATVKNPTGTRLKKSGYYSGTL